MDKHLLKDAGLAFKSIGSLMIYVFIVSIISTLSVFFIKDPEFKVFSTFLTLMIQLVLFGLVISYFFRAGNMLIEFSESSSDSESLRNTPKTEVDEYWEKLKSTNKEKSTSIKKTTESRGDWTDEFV